MELNSLDCPNCGANINYVEDEIDMFYCKYCRCKILIDGQSDAAYFSKSKIKEMKHNETMRNNAYEHEKYKMRREDKQKTRSWWGHVGVAAVICAILWFMSTSGEREAEKLELELQATVDEIMIDIENEDFDSAYIKANQLYWESSYTSEGEDKWDATRESILEQIEEAEKAAEKDADGTGIFDWF